MTEKPFIVWIPCKEAFFLDGLQITAERALQHWRARTAIFGPNAKAQIKFIEWQYEFTPMGFVNCAG
jgi:hypothetical protein